MLDQEKTLPVFRVSFQLPLFKSNEKKKRLEFTRPMFILRFE